MPSLCYLLQSSNSNCGAYHRRFGPSIGISLIVPTIGNAQNPQELDDVILSCWVEITSIMRVSNLRLFPSKFGTMNLIRSGEYFEILQEFQPLLNAWWKKFESLDCTYNALSCIPWLTSNIVPDYPRIILSIEFEYACKLVLSCAFPFADPP